MHKGKPKSRAPVAVHEETDFFRKIIRMQTSHQQNRTPVDVYFVNYYVYLSLALSVCRQGV